MASSIKIVSKDICIGALILYILFKIFNRKNYNLPPVPPGKFLINNLNDFIAPLAYKLWANEYRKKYGDVFLLYVGREPTVIVNDFNLAVEAFVSKYPNDLAGRPNFFLFRKVTGDGLSIVMADYGPRLKLQRKLVHSALRSFMKGPTVERLVERSFEQFQEERKSFGNDYVEPKHYIQQLFYNVICSALFGDYYDMSDRTNYEVLFNMKEATNKFDKLGFLEIAPFLWHLPLKNVIFMKKFMVLIRKFCQDKIQLHQENISTEPRDITDCFLNEIRESPKSKDLIDDVIIRESLGDLIFAGTDTSATVMYWLVGLLACNPDIQERIYQEISQYKATLPPGDKSVGISWRDHLPFTQAVILEGIRYGSIVPRGIPYMALNDVKIGGYDVPKGATVVLNQYAFHNDPKFWTNPELFQPERFLDSSGNVLPKQPGLSAFGLGARTCVGEIVAKADMFMLLVLLCTNYKFEWDPQNKDSNIREWELNNFTRSPASFKMAFKTREN